MSDYNKKEIGHRIKGIRMNKGMTLEEFGKLFGASKSSVLGWERGDNIPNPERLKKIAEIGGVDLDFLLNGDVFDSFKKGNEELIDFVKTLKQWENLEKEELDEISKFDEALKQSLEQNENNINNLSNLYDGYMSDIQDNINSIVDYQKSNIDYRKKTLGICKNLLSQIDALDKIVRYITLLKNDTIIVTEARKHLKDVINKNDDIDKT
ncbi:helix-turn-helix domain-containing protein [Enterococcus cecorum]|uniref:helix-turn-helix domain-containing protein n=1 Tax=Enterococcus cecorum TaxID=44008 RepID=UPI00069943A4|nr:helix-turn-helix transcriptional regulator [Enterococcus cecorum]